uniref:Uncharacterized protein n=1 Tax=Arundo donax TaxID=35708 RepID=A0A0A9BT89_ARUDO
MEAAFRTAVSLSLCFSRHVSPSFVVMCASATCCINVSQKMRCALKKFE